MYGTLQEELIPFEEYYWMLKHTFPGDREFCWGEYANLPYTYVIEAVQRGRKAVISQAHITERPIAQLTAILFNVNRGKKTKPVRPEELYQYASQEDLNLPSGRFGRAMERAISESLFPSWALFTYKELAKSAAGPCPEEYIALCDDVCVLAPEVDGGILHGLVIAQESAGNKVRQLVSPSGAIYTVRIPKVPTKFVAEEGWELELLNVQQPPEPV